MVGGELLVIYTQAVAGGVGVGEHAGLEHWILLVGRWRGEMVEGRTWVT